MHHARTALGIAARACLALACAAGSSAVIAGGGHSGGGDGSMNPYTGDSYAYFHGGHNLGEQGTIRPGGTPPPTGWSLWPAHPVRNDAPKAAATTAPTARFAPPPERDIHPATPDAAPPR